MRRGILALAAVIGIVAIFGVIRQIRTDVPDRAIRVTGQPMDVSARTADGEVLPLYSESHALVIGVSHYLRGWRSLPGVIQDVDSISAVLEMHGFSVDIVLDPDRDALYAAFEDFIAQYGHVEHARLLVYFAGHGYTMSLAFGRELGYIVPADAPDPRQKRAEFTAKAMDMEQIRVYAKRIEAKHVLFVFDACFSGTVFSILRSPPPASISYKTSEPVRQFISSGSAGEQVPDESVFRKQFCAALGGSADQNADGYVTGVELGEFLQESVINYTDGSQHPQYGKLRDRQLDRGDFVFATSGLAKTASSVRLDRPRTMLAFPASAAAFRQATFDGRVRHPRLSPDGQFLAYVTDRDGGGESVFVQDLHGGPSLEVFAAKRVYDLRWSANGSSLLFADGREATRLIPRLGGPARTFRFFGVVAMSPDGKLLAGAFGTGEKKIQLTHVVSGDTTTIALSGEYERLEAFQWSPTGEQILLLTDDGLGTRAIWTLDLDGEQRMVKVVERRDIATVAWGPEGRAIYFLLARGRSSELWKIPVDAEIRTTGRAVPLLSGLRGEGPITVSQDGKTMSFLGTGGHSNLWVVQMDGSGEGVAQKRLTAGTHFDVDPRISPDGRLVAFSRYAGATANIYTVPIEGGRPTQVTFFESRNSNPVWSPNAETLAFASDDNDRLRVWTVPAAGGAARSCAGTLLSIDRDLSWAPSHRILYQRPGNHNYHFLDPARGYEAPLLDDDWAGWASNPLVSPGGKRFAIHRNHFEGGGIWVLSLEDSLRHPVMLSRNAEPLRWSDDGRRLYARDEDRIVRVPTRKRFRGLPYAGIHVSDIDTELRRKLGLKHDRGVVVTLVNPRGLASREGMLVGDVIVAWDGEVIHDKGDIVRLLRASDPWDRCAFTVERGTESIQLQLTLQERFWTLMRDPDDEVETLARLPFDNVIGVSMGPDTTKVVCAVEEAITDAWLIDHFDPETPYP